MEGKFGIGLKGIYEVELKDSITGKIKQKETFHNMGTYHLEKLMIREGWSGSGDYQIYFNMLRLGTNSTPPQYSDAGCKSAIWSNTNPTTRTWLKIDSYTYKVNMSFTYPATSSYVATGICEASILTNTGYACTRCLFTDSEDQVITFNKTALDILTINVELTMSMHESENAKMIMFKEPLMIRGAMGETFAVRMGTYAREYYKGFLGLLCYDSDKNYICPQITDNPNGADSYFAVMQTIGYKLGAVINASGGIGVNYYFDDANQKCGFTNNVYRIANTTLTSETYFRGIANSCYGCLMLPDETLFPTYTISDIPIGTGDGTTVQFDNPLSYFKENTEVVKVDGVSLTRGTDYTINHRGNINKKLEICQDIVPTTSLSDLKNDNVIWKDYTGLLCPMFIPTMCFKRMVKDTDTSQYCYGINADNPAILDYGESKTFNFIKGTNIRAIRKQKSNNAYAQLTTATTIYVDSSNDGETWSEVGSAQISSTAINLDFNQPVTARYWRIRSSMAAEDNDYYYMVVVCPSAYNIFTEHCGIALGLRDPYIVFTNAPADGAVITMDVGMDIMMKNENFAIDVQMTVNVNIE